jgi:integral membrane protein
VTDASDGENRRLLHRLEIASAVEAATLLLLVTVAVPLKHLAGWPAGVRVLGPVHGLAFIAFAWLAVQAVAASPQAWSAAERARLFAGALLPLGGFLNLRMIARKART